MIKNLHQPKRSYFRNLFNQIIQIIKSLNIWEQEHINNYFNLNKKSLTSIYLMYKSEYSFINMKIFFFLNFFLF